MVERSYSCRSDHLVVQWVPCEKCPRRLARALQKHHEDLSRISRVWHEGFSRLTDMVEIVAMTQDRPCQRYYFVNIDITPQGAQGRWYKRCQG